MNLTELKQDYDRYLELNYSSIRTISSYQNCFKKFIESNTRLYRMSKKDLQIYFVQFNQDYSVSYYNQIVDI